MFLVSESQRCRRRRKARPDVGSFIYGEFDSGSERTLAAWIRHASRTGSHSFNLRKEIVVESGERVRNTWVIYLTVGDNLGKLGLIPNVIFRCISEGLKAGIFRDPSLREEPASHQLVGKVMAYQGLRVAGLRGWSATLGLRHCPDSYGRLQSRIIRNARKCDDATLRGG